MPALKHCYNIHDLRKRARSKLPAPMFHCIDGGADDEWTLRHSTDAFNNYELLSRFLVDVGDIDLRTRVLGQELALPFFLSPTGLTRLFHHDKEIAVARAAQNAGTMYTVSTMANTRLEDIATASNGPKMFQIYIFRDRELTREFVQRCKSAGYDALCLTVDVPVAGNRERDLYNGLSMPPRFTLANLWSYATHCQWAFNLARNPGFSMANVAHRTNSLDSGTMNLMQYVNSQFDPTVTWEDAAWLAEQWDGPFVIKGLHTPEDAQKAVDIGASALMISNHGGRQLDGAPAPVDSIAPIRDAVGDALELIMDGGIRRGTHVLKALALGADACSIGRPYLYGLAAGGQAGVEHALTLLRSEIERDMVLLGCRSVSQLGGAHVQQRRDPAQFTLSSALV